MGYMHLLNCLILFLDMSKPVNTFEFKFSTADLAAIEFIFSLI